MYNEQRPGPQACLLAANYDRRTFGDCGNCCINLVYSSSFFIISLKYVRYLSSVHPYF
ncbi:hypothetical protein D3C80_1691060 [compost metagenome]